jgi:DNA polymerase-3 subunit gamma/tau
LFDGLWNDGKDPAAVLNELAGLMRDVLLTKVAPNGCAGLISGLYAMNTLQEFSSRLTAEELSADMESIRASDLGGSSPRRSAELCLIGLCSPALSDSLPELRARVANLEQLVQGGAAAPATPSVPELAPFDSRAATPAQIKATKSEIPPTYGKITKADEVPSPTMVQEPDTARESASVPEGSGRAASTPAPAPADPSDVPADAEFWKALLARLRGKLDIGTYSLVSGPNVAGKLSGGTLTISFGDNPFIKGILESGDVSSVLRQEAAALAGHPVKFSLAARSAAVAQPDLDKLGELSKFENFKFE